MSAEPKMTCEQTDAHIERFHRALAKMRSCQMSIQIPLPHGVPDTPEARERGQAYVEGREPVRKIIPTDKELLAEAVAALERIGSWWTLASARRAIALQALARIKEHVDVSAV